MKTSIFITIILVSGALAGLVQGTANLVTVEPYLDMAIEIESQDMLDRNQYDDLLDYYQVKSEYDSYRDWQKGGQVLAAVTLGIAVGALFGIVFALSKKIIPGKNDIIKGVILAGIMWSVLYVVPFLKYPASLPGTGSGETLVMRTALYLIIMAVSGFGALGFYRFSKRFAGHKKFIAFAGYTVLVSSMFFVLPGNPDDTGSSEILDSFRLASFLSVGLFWLSVGAIMGFFWMQFKPDIQEYSQYK